METNFIEKYELDRIDNYMNQNDCVSMTTEKYRTDILHFIVNNKDKGEYICEVGPYKGGLTAQIAYVCKTLGKKLIICEAVLEYAKIVEKNLNKLGYSDIAEINVMPFVEFVAQKKLLPNTILTIIDANHIYPYALQNFRALASVRENTHAAAFHDFGLHDTDDTMGVERAVRETFIGEDIYHIGSNTHFRPCPLHATPAQDKTFFRGSEGALIILSKKLS